MTQTNTGLKAILGAFIFLIVALALIGSIANSTTDATEAKTVTNESMALINVTAVASANNQWDSVTRIGNASLTLTSGSNYTVDLTQGEVTLLSGTTLPTTGTYDVSYVYRNVGDTTSRGLINLIVLFFAIAILVTTIAYLSPSFREMMGMG